MLTLINDARADAGLGAVEPGQNPAAQIHADGSLANCYYGHWGMDGLKSYMRYSLTGGYQSNAENAVGLNYCVKASDGYRPLSGIYSEVRKAMRGLMNSPGHRATILDPAHRKVNIGLAWNRYNIVAYQIFEGDYVEYTALPEIDGGRLSLAGQVKNGATFGEGDFNPVAIYYDHPPHELTRGQLSRTYCLPLGEPAAFLRKPLPSGWHYQSDYSRTTQDDRCPDPYDISPNAPAPNSPDQSHQLWREAQRPGQTVTVSFINVPSITASKWQLSGDQFSVEADLSGVLAERGAGVYTVLLWGLLNGDAEVISKYSIFHGITPPDGYGGQ